MLALMLVCHLLASTPNPPPAAPEPDPQRLGLVTRTPRGVELFLEDPDSGHMVLLPDGGVLVTDIDLVRGAVVHVFREGGHSFDAKVAAQEKGGPPGRWPSGGRVPVPDGRGVWYLLDLPPHERLAKVDTLAGFIDAAALPGKDARYRHCVSAEGVHLTIWSGRPLRSRRLWHAYLPLGYDVDPSSQACTEKDYE